MCILVLPSSINLAAKNDQYICAERKGRGKNEEGEREKKKHELRRSGSISVEYGKKLNLFFHMNTHMYF